MPRKKDPRSARDPALQLKTLTLRDDPLVAEYRDVLYPLSIDALRGQGYIASGETTPALSDRKRSGLMAHLQKLRGRICKKYRIKSFAGGDPFFVKKKDWLSNLRVSTDERLSIETNWRTSFSPRVEFYLIPKNAQVFSSERGTLYQLPPLPKRPLASPPIMTLHVDLSQVKRNSLADLADEFKRAVRRCLKLLPRNLRKPPSTWSQNIDRDYRRFRQHFYHGVPYRWIAAYERMGAMPTRSIGAPVPTESSVRESVERVHLMLFRKPYKLFRKSFKARKHVSHRADTRLVHEITSFDCPEHGQDCGSSCQYALNFIKNLR